MSEAEIRLKAMELAMERLKIPPSPGTLNPDFWSLVEHYIKFIKNV